jgi:hypothetical protein
VTGRWFPPVSFTNKIDPHDIAEILLKVALNTITLTLYLFLKFVIILPVYVLAVKGEEFSDLSIYSLN